jgi:shikimate dehydrogenase
MINGDTRVYSLFGSPVAHTLSPAIFNPTFEKLSLNSIYLPLEVRKDNLEQAVEAARTFKLSGFNVTMPLKTSIPEMLDSLDKTAKEITAVNTVARTQNGLIGYNTDGEGAVRALRSYGFEPSNKRIVVVGAGGAAKALVHHLSTERSEITVLNRTPNKAREIIDRTSGKGRVIPEQLNDHNLERCLRDTDILINATPIQTPELLSNLKISLASVREIDWVFDMAYDKPSIDLPTRNGTISPLEMLLQQAALSYEIWFGKPAPLDLMRSSLISYLGKNWR